MNYKARKLVFILSLMLLATLLLSACAASTASQQPAGESDQQVVTVFKSPT